MKHQETVESMAGMTSNTGHFQLTTYQTISMWDLIGSVTYLGLNNNPRIEQREVYV